MRNLNGREARRTPQPSGGRYEIVVGARLGRRWADWFEGFEIVDGEGTTRLVGVVPDQAALHAALSRIRDLGVPLVSVRRMDNEGQEA